MTGGTYNATIPTWPEDERPREKLAKMGPEGVTDAELLAILLRVGTRGQDVVRLAMDLLAESQGIVGLNRLTLTELKERKGMGPAKATTLQAAFELGRRAVLVDGPARFQVRSARDVANLLERTLSGKPQEQMHVVLLSTKNHVLGMRMVYKGNLNSAIVRPAEIFRDAIRENAASIIVVHNHPSGDPEPSAEDVRVTRDLVSAGKLLDIDVLDHVVMGSHEKGYVSLRERRLGFEEA